MKNKLVSLTIAATVAVTGTSAYAATGNSKAAAGSSAIKPLTIDATDSDSIIRYKGKTIVSGKLKYNMVNESGFPVEFTVDKKSKAMIPKAFRTDYPIAFAIEADNPQIQKLKLNEKKCYFIPMTVEIDGYYSVNDDGGYDGANLIKIIKKGTPALTSCNVE